MITSTDISIQRVEDAKVVTVNFNLNVSQLNFESAPRECVALERWIKTSLGHLNLLVTANPDGVTVIGTLDGSYTMPQALKFAGLILKTATDHA